jgi:hypothetical protein
MQEDSTALIRPLACACVKAVGAHLSWSAALVFLLLGSRAALGQVQTAYGCDSFDNSLAGCGGLFSPPDQGVVAIRYSEGIDGGGLELAAVDNGGKWLPVAWWLGSRLRADTVRSEMWSLIPSTKHSR